jgi:predicted nucleotidyltransferase
MVSLDEIHNMARMIANAYHPDKIILFGSYAYGTPGEDSDVDVLVVLPFEGKSIHKTIEILQRVKPVLPVDLIVRTPDQIAQRLKMGDFFLREIVEKGKVLYEATH